MKNTACVTIVLDCHTIKIMNTRTDNIRPSAHLRVILPTTMDSNMPRTFIDMNNMQEISPPTVDFSAPPPYDMVANSKLPTYEEVQQEKQMEGEDPPQLQGPLPYQPAFTALVTVESTEPTAEQIDRGNSLLGTDIMFFTSFLVAFLFNWIGFLVLMCFCRTVASRYGALAGFGLSLTKWTLIVKHSTELASREISWLWWLIMAFGILICVRAIIQYLNIKRGWYLLSGTAQERLLFFY